MTQRPKVLLLDDDPDLLELYQEMLSRLPSQPEVRTASSGAKAIAMLEAEPFSLLLSDLNMPKMDGLQVLTVVRRKYPQLRTAVMTAVTDPQFRMRAYAMGLDLYLEKPTTSQATQLFLDCIEALLGQETHVGFRGMQSKSLVDIVQLECLSQSSLVLRINNGQREGRIWFQNGEIIDAVTSDHTGQNAFTQILAWKTGNFELLPPEPAHPRTILGSYQNLLLETAQALDEGKAGVPAPEADRVDGPLPPAPSRAAELGQQAGVEFVLLAGGGSPAALDAFAVENPDGLAAWTRRTLENFAKLGAKMQAGEISQVIALGLQRHAAMTSGPAGKLCVGFERSMLPGQIQETMNDIYHRWLS